MSTNNPLFPSDNSQILPSDDDTAGKPVPDEKNPAADMIRRKLEAIYSEEPEATQELAEVKAAEKPLSKHQKVMRDLNASGRPMPEIQAAWHQYYTQLPEHEKHEVWQEFYAASRQLAAQNTKVFVQPAAHVAPEAIIAEHRPPVQHKPTETHHTVSDVKKQVLHKVRNNNTNQKHKKLTARHHIQSLAFGLGLGSLAVVFVLFSFFNQLIISPLIQPSRHVNDTPLIVSADSIAPTSTPEVIIPKINVEIPVDYSQTSTDESVIENALLNGVVHYPNTVMPGQNGNAAFFGHSSNNIFNPGKYKFAFVLLHQLTNGDTFYLTSKGKVYAYQVISHKIVPPNDVGVLTDTQGKAATATLITCDPPGTSINRLVVTGVQISPDPGGNTNPTITAQATPPTTIASNGPSLWSRLWSAVF